MTSRDPFEPSGWLGWGILAVFAILLVYGSSVSQAQDTGPARPDGAAPPADVVCAQGWCAVRQDTLKQILTNLQALDQHTRYLRSLCGWKDK